MQTLAIHSRSMVTEAACVVRGGAGVLGKHYRDTGMLVGRGEAACKHLPSTALRNYGIPDHQWGQGTQDLPQREGRRAALRC